MTNHTSSVSVSVSTDHDTKTFTVQSLRGWWQTMRRGAYLDATRLLITADGGGHSSARPSLWKLEPQHLTDESLSRSASTPSPWVPPHGSAWNTGCSATSPRTGMASRLFTHEVAISAAAPFFGPIWTTACFDSPVPGDPPKGDERHTKQPSAPSRLLWPVAGKAPPPLIPEGNAPRRLGYDGGQRSWPWSLCARTARGFARMRIGRLGLRVLRPKLHSQNVARALATVHHPFRVFPGPAEGDGVKLGLP